MSAPTFSILHASYGRPAKAVLAMERWLNNAAWTPKLRDTIQYIFALNDDDPTASDLRTMADCAAAKHLLDVVYVTGPFSGSAPAWDAAAKASTGGILIQAQDDCEPPQNWDRLLYDKISMSMTWPPFFVAVSDGYRKDGFCHMAIMDRGYYELQGEFIHAGYTSVWSDDDAYYRAKRAARDGLAWLIEARDLVFLHRCHVHDPSVPDDATYARENSAEAYAQGAALFAARNPEAAGSGLVTWR